MQRFAPSPVLVVLVLLTSSGRLAAQSQAPDLELATGIRQVLEGEFEAAVVTLDSAARRLSGQTGHSKDAARAYLYLAVAYLGLSEEAKAKSRFLDAINFDSTLSVTPQEFPPRVIRLFEEARREAGIASPQPSPAPPPPKTVPAPATAKKGGSKALPILLGVGGAAAVGAVVAGSGGKGSPDPSTVDDDRDGFSEAQGDCNDSNPAVRPGGAVTARAQILGRANLVGCATGWRFSITVTNNSCQSVTVGQVHLAVPRATPGCGYTFSSPPLVPTVTPGQTATVLNDELRSCGSGFCSFRFEWLVDTSAGTLNAGGFDVDIVLDRSCRPCR